MSQTQTTSTESEITRSKSSERPSSHSHFNSTCEKECANKGSHLCLQESEKEIIKMIPDKSVHSFDEESLHSGESMFKAFSFEVQEKDPEVAKCMAFWKSTLTKNVKPLRCTTLRSKNNEKVIKKKKERVDKKEPEEMWLEMYKELQKRKLDQYKLMKPKKCDPCDSYIDEESEKKQEVQNIKDLNNWQSGGSRAMNSKIDVQAQVQRTLQVLKTTKSQESVKQEVPTKHENNPSRSKISAKPQKTPEAVKKDTKNLSQGDFKTVPKIKSGEIIKTDRKVEAETKLTEVCCKCGCDKEDCICLEMEDCIQDSTDREKSCKCCSCPSDNCTCGINEKVPIITCLCGCGSADCVCKEPSACRCGCGIEGCTCGNLQEKEPPCPCECGLKECLCQQLFTKSCGCGHADCDCTMIEMLNAYIESLDTPLSGRKSDSAKESSLVNREVQTEQQPSREGQGKYCIICGHFNCLCTVEGE